MEAVSECEKSLLRHKTRSHHEGTRCFVLESYVTFEEVESDRSSCTTACSLLDNEFCAVIELALPLDWLSSSCCSMTDELVDTPESVEDELVRVSVARLLSWRCMASCSMACSE